jgi:opacity protein-like surface antigen
MRRYILLITCLLAFAAAGFAQSGRRTPAGRGHWDRGEKGVSSIGGIAGYGVENKAALIGIDYRYNILSRMRLSPSVVYARENNSTSAFYINADAHYLARLSEKATIYPLGGIGVSIRNERQAVAELPEPEPDDETPVEAAAALSDSTFTRIRVGLNLGFGGEIRVTRDLILGIEFRYNLTGRRIYNQAMLAARAACYF